MREFAAKQNSGAGEFIAADEAEAGMEEMAKLYDEKGRVLYLPEE